MWLMPLRKGIFYLILNHLILNSHRSLVATALDDMVLDNGEVILRQSIPKNSVCPGMSFVTVATRHACKSGKCQQ